MSLMGGHDLRFRVYAGAVTIAAVAGMVASWTRSWALGFGSALVVICVSSVVSEMLAVSMPSGGSLSLTYPLNVSAAILFGPAGAGVVALVSLGAYLVQRPRAAWSRVVFNVGQTLLSALVAAWAYVLAGGRPLASTGPLSERDFPHMLLALLLVGTLGILANFGFVGFGYALQEGMSLRRVWQVTLSWMIASQVALGFLGIAIAQVVAAEGPQGFALFVIPLVVARQMHRRYLSLREAYADTVRSLVAAIEAKDPYTKGHSVRVAHFAKGLARALDLDEQQVDRLEIAALLHDLGKIGISRAILSKPTSLTSDEYLMVKQHPDIAARILESVPFLDDVLPAVQSHHERVDGDGYGQALHGEQIPVGARILAIADSYDAMTADRPYRAAYTTGEARAELVRGRGSQFDAELVDVFLGALAGMEPQEESRAESDGPERGGAGG